MFEDKLLLKLVDEIDRGFTRTQYEKLLVELGLYSLSTLTDNKEYSRRTKHNLILVTLRVGDHQNIITNGAYEEKGFPEELISLLAKEGIELKQHSAVLQVSNARKNGEIEAKKDVATKEKFEAKSIKSKAQPESIARDRVDNTSVFLIIPIIVIIISLVLMLTRIWDWTIAVGISTLVIAIFAYVNDLLKPRINQEIARSGIWKNALGIFLTITIVFFIALLLSLQKSTSDLNKKIIEINRNYDDAVSTLSIQQSDADKNQQKINKQSTQIANLSSTQVFQSARIIKLEGTATQNAVKIVLLEATLQVFLPTPTSTPSPATLMPAPTIQLGVIAPCNCSGSDLGCADFSSPDSAQACYDYCYSAGFGDVFNLDGSDIDNLACKTLP